MTVPLFWLFIALILDRAYVQFSAVYYDNPNTGFGSIDGILGRTALAPMAYRPLH